MPRPKQSVSIFSLAKEFGVSAPTVSKALSNSTEVSESVRNRVRARAKQLNFKPHSPRRRTLNICALLDFEFLETFRIDGYVQGVVEGVYAFCSERGAEFSIYGESSERLEKQNLVRELHSRNANGAVIVGSSNRRNYFETLKANYFPFCCVYDGPAKRTILADNQAAGRLACAHLISAGYCRLGIARHMDGRTASSDRFMGFVHESAKSQQQVTIKELIPSGGLAGFSWGRWLLDAWIQDEKPYDALFTLAENVAIGFLSAAAEHGIRIPQDVAVMTCDNLPVCEQAAPPLSVVDIPNYQAGYYAAAEVWRQLASKPQEHEYHPLDKPLPVERIISRASTR